MHQHMATTPPSIEALEQDILAFIHHPTPQEACSDAQFNALALRLFHYQYSQNQPFRQYCQGLGVRPRQVKTWRDIPAVPIDAFKALELRCQPPLPDERVFMTSGTTGRGARGQHFHPRLAVYDASMRRNFAQRFMQGVERLPMGIVFPDTQAMPNSSLAHYLGLALRDFGAAGSRYFLGAEGLDMDGLCAALAEAERTGQPYALLGASFSLVHVMDGLRALGRSFRLPAGSRVLDTGGYKGQSRELPLEQFYADLAALLGVPPSHCINMYGMTELSTQFYDSGNAQQPAPKSGPHWIRSRLVEPLSGREMPPGQEGILVHCDLANYNAVSTILTEDVGRWVEGQEGQSFYLLGRAQGAQAKGCSLAVDAFIQAAQA